MTRTFKLLAATSALALLGACADSSRYGEAGRADQFPGFGESTENNYLIHSGQKSYVIDLAERFNKEVPDTVTFAFNSATLDGQARQILAGQANFMRQFPEVTFRVFGHTDKVGSSAYNKRLGLRRAQAVVRYLSSQGISTSRLEAVVSYGETQPLIATEGREERNRRTVTEVSGFVQDNPLILNGKYAEVIFREYVDTAQSAPLQTQGGLDTLLAGAGG